MLDPMHFELFILTRTFKVIWKDGPAALLITTILIGMMFMQHGEALWLDNTVSPFLFKNVSHNQHLGGEGGGGEREGE